MDKTPTVKPHPRVLSRRRFLYSMLAGLLSGCQADPYVAADRVVMPTPLPTPARASTPTPIPPTQVPTPTPPPHYFSGDMALQHVVAQMNYVPRHTGTEGWRKCGDYILEQFALQGWQTEEQPFTYKDTQCRNLIAKRGNGPVLVLGAHYDSRRQADHDPNPALRTKPVPAANDGASGVAVLIEMARVLKPEALQRSIWLVAFDAEDNGGLDGWDWIIGSRHFVSALTVVPQGMVLFDMIGDADQQIYYEHNSHREMSVAIWDIATSIGYETFIQEYRHSMIDDHIPFVQQGIPAVDLIDFDYPYWHTTADTLDKVSAPSLESVGRTVEDWLLNGAAGMPAPASCLEQHELSLCYHGCQMIHTYRSRRA